MEYSKPKVTIDLDEYTTLLKIKGETYDVDQVATVAANIAAQLNQTTDFKYLTDVICRDLDYTIDIKLNNVTASRSEYLVARVIKKLK